MRFAIYCVTGAALLLAGCEAQPVAAPPAVATPATPPPAAPEPAATDVSGTPPLALDALALPLTPENTRIEFVGTHAGEKPDPRKGSFGKFTGKLQADLAALSLKSISFEIDTDSVATEFPKLTEHLKSPDFFEVREHPKATFQSTKIEPSQEEPGKLTVTGNLTLHGVTKEIKAPISVELTPTGPSLKSEFTLDRSEFGMNYAPDKVENKVALTVVISQMLPSEKPAGEQP